MRYKIKIHKVLEDGTEVEIMSMVEPGWYASPFLERMAKKIYEPRPKPNFEGQGELFYAKAA